MPPRNMPAPVHLTMKELFEGELPTRPVALQLTAAQVKRLSDKAEMVKKVPPGVKGMLVVPDPFGNLQGFLVCAGQSTPDSACVPRLKSAGVGGVTFGSACKCYGGTEKPERTPAGGCSVVFTRFAGMTCVGTCTGTKKCTLKQSPNGPNTLYWCECA